MLAVNVQEIQEQGTGVHQYVEPDLWEYGGM
jgi:hypothetical protein